MRVAQLCRQMGKILAWNRESLLLNNKRNHQSNSLSDEYIELQLDSDEFDMLTSIQSFHLLKVKL